jgi:TonB family protein
MLYSEWQKPLNFSVGLHIIAVAIAILAPFLFDQKPRLPEIYTVNLFTATEVAETLPPQAKTPAAKPAVRQIKPEVKKPAVSIKPSKPEVAVPVKKAIVKPVSLKPIKQKVKVGKTKEEEEIDNAKISQVVNRIKANAEAKAKAQHDAKTAKTEAEQSAKDAVSKLADALKTTTPGPVSGSSEKAAMGQTGSTTRTAGVSGPKGTGVEPEFYMKQYLSAVYQKIHDHWILPDLQNWDNSLEAVLSITIGRDGTITDSHFERKSANIYFNQFVLKAVKEASPMPPFPDKLIENSLEIGLRFKPGELN